VHFEEAHKQENSEFMANTVALSFEKLNTYFTTLIYEPDVSYYTITTALNPALRLNWFQTQWKHYPQWVTKAQNLLKKVFDDYVKQDAMANSDELQELPPSRHKLPASDFYSWATAVNTHLLTGSKNKCQQHLGQLMSTLKHSTATSTPQTRERGGSWNSCTTGRGLTAVTGTPYSSKWPLTTSPSHLQVATASAPSAPCDAPSLTTETGLAAAQLRH
jgi:hypothetical protein